MPSAPVELPVDMPRIGEKWLSAARTVTESDIVQFAGLSGDFNSIHIDRVHAERSRHGQRIAHGLLVAAIASGLLSRTARNQQIDQRIIALLKMECEWLHTVHLGDTLSASQKVMSIRQTRDGQRSIVDFERVVTNQHGKAVLRCTVTQMLTHR